MSVKYSNLPSAFFAGDGKRLSFAAYAVLVLICLAFFMPGFASLPPTDRDESLFAQASKQMIESGNYADIRVQDNYRYKKPIGIYWLQAASVKLLSGGHLDAIWAYRVPSAVGATIAVLMTAAIGALLFGPAAGFLAALMIAGCLIVNVEARLAKTDAALLATILVAQYGLARAYRESVKGFGVPFAFWTAIGAGILLKGPIILITVASTLVWLRLTEKNLRWFSVLRPLPGIIYALLLVSPWLIAIGILSHGAFYRQSVGHDMFGKIAKGEFRIIPPGAHLLAFPAVFFPFSLFALLAAPDAWAKRGEPAVRFCLGWIIPAWIVFELSLTKLPHYVMPLYPAIALLAAKALLDGFPSLAQPRWRWLPPLVLSVWLLIGTALALGLALGPYVTDHMWNQWGIIAGIIILVTQGVTLFFLFQNRGLSVIALAAGSMMAFTCTFGMTLPYLQRVWVSRQVVEIAEAMKPCAKLQIVSATYNEPSLIFLAGTDTRFESDGGAAAADMRRNPCLLALIDTDHAPAFAAAFPDASALPELVGHIDGFNMGHGGPIGLRLYRWPQKTEKP
jgi:4-amino-4-deoxy-L-arabinose transferase-like glycosyltransferase